MSPNAFDWSRFHAYRVFDEFLERFVLHRKSYITRHPDTLDLDRAFEDIRQRFIVSADESDAPYEEKIVHQFRNASDETKIIFANVEYLWAMPAGNLKPETKRAYGERWFSSSRLLHSGERFYFDHPHTIADPGRWYLQNKYWEVVALLRVLRLLTQQPSLADVASLKRKTTEICHSAIYQGVPADEMFTTSTYCGVHSALMHLSDPDRFESIISESHKRQIRAVFGHVVDDPSTDAEVHLKQIRNALFESLGNGDDPDRKHRWFFYTKDVEPMWIDKKTAKQQRFSSAVFDVRLEEDAADLEGDRHEVSGFRIRRSAKLVNAAKARDNYTCQACGFHFKKQIVHVHHLDPLSESKRPKETTLNDLVTLCPTCHYLAHYWLRENTGFKKRETLLAKLRSVKAP